MVFNKSFLKKIAIILIIIAIIYLALNFTDIKNNNLLKNYDFVIGTMDNNGPFSSNKKLYGFKDGKAEIIGDNFYYDGTSMPNVIAGTDEFVTYFDYDTWRELKEKATLGGGLGRFDIGNNNIDILKEYDNNYSYDEKEKEVFNNMMNYILTNNLCDKHNYHWYYIVSNNNYYLCKNSESGYEVLKYDNDNNTLTNVINFTPQGEINYFQLNDK